MLKHPNSMFIYKITLKFTFFFLSVICEANNLYLACRSFDENGSYNPGKEIKAETQTYYQALIDNRDSPFVVSLQEPKPPICKTPE